MIVKYKSLKLGSVILDSIPTTKYWIRNSKAMQYATPQFIEEEGKIIFFLTFRQFFLLIGGGITSLGLFYVLPLWLSAICGIAIMLTVAAVAFLKIEGESIVKLLMHFVGFTMEKKNYMWKKKDLPQQPNMKEMSALQPSKIRSVKKIMETKK